MQKVRSPRNSKEAILKRKTLGVRHGRHCVFLMHVHLVFVAKYRKKLFTQEILEFMESVFRDVCQDFEAQLKEFTGETDHVHLLIHYPPKVSVSKLVNSLKGVSSRYIRAKQWPTLHKYIWMDSLWSGSYFAGSCGGAPLEAIKQYIEQQQTPQH
jgi:REP-associated tyrosine transposase